MVINRKEKNTILGIEKNQIFCNRGDLVIGFKFDFKEKYSLSKKDFEEIHTNMVKALKSLPVGTIVVKSDLYENKKYDTSVLPNDTFIQRKTVDYFKDASYMKHNSYIFLVFPRLDTFKNDSIKNPFKFPSIQNFRNDDAKINSFRKEAEKFKEVINKEGYSVLIELTEKEILSFEDFYFSGFQWNYTTDSTIKKDHIKVDDKYIGLFSIVDEKNLPNHISPSKTDKEYSNSQEDFVFHQGFADDFTFNIKCNHIYNQIIFIDDSKTHLKKISQAREEIKSASTLAPENKISLKKIDEDIKDIVDKEVHIIRGYNSVIFCTDTKEDFEQSKIDIETTFRALDIKPYFPKGVRLKSHYLNSFFSNVSCLDNNSLYKTDINVAACLFINNTNYKSEEEGIIFNERLFNTPVKYDFWDEYHKQSSSRNTIIVAPTGSGKSVTWLHICRQLIEQDVTNVIIDLGDSYLKFSKLLPKEDVTVFRYKEGDSLGLNPFIVKGKITTEHLESVAEFVWTVIKRGKEPTQEERTSLRLILATYYDIITEEHCFKSFYKFIEKRKQDILKISGIKEKEYFDVEQFLHSGGDFVNGAYSFLFADSEEKSQQFIGKKLVIFELDSIKDNKLLLTIMLQTISDAIHKIIWKDKSKKGFVFFDEFAKQLEFPDVLNQVAFFFQAIRKQNGAVGIILQTLNQLPDAPKAKSILDNTETYIYLATEKDKYRASIARMNLNKHVQAQMFSMKNNFSGNTKYSEILIVRNRHVHVYRIVLPPEALLAFQTEGKLHDEMMQLYEKNGSMEQTINQIMKA